MTSDGPSRRGCRPASRLEAGASRPPLFLEKKGVRGIAPAGFGREPDPPKRRNVAWLLVLALGLLSCPAVADGDLDYSLRADYWSSSRDLDHNRTVGQGALWLRDRTDLSDNLRIKAEGWLSANDRQQEKTLRGELREGYLDWQADDIHLRAGRQIEVWGRADKINPTDSLSSRDYTLLFPEDDDQRRGQAMVRGSIDFGQNTLSLYWLPEFRPNLYPVPPVPNGVYYVADDVPDTPWAFAGKLDHSAAVADWSLSYYQGRDHNPDTAIKSLGPNGLALQRTYQPIKVIGADIAATTGGWGMRAETAYTLTSHSDGRSPFVRPPLLATTLGLEHKILWDVTARAQYLLRYSINYRDPRGIADSAVRAAAIQTALDGNQLNRLEHGASLRLGKSWWNETLVGEITAVNYFAEGDYMLSAKLTYAFTDRLSGSIGGTTYGGGETSYFGRLRLNRGIFMEMKYGF